MEKLTNSMYFAIIVLVLMGAFEEAFKSMDDNWVATVISPIMAIEVLLAVSLFVAALLKRKLLKGLGWVLLGVLTIDVLLSPVSITPLSFLTSSGPSYYKIERAEAYLIEISRYYFIAGSIVVLICLKLVARGKNT
ncbi:MAG: hypothetical protein MI867_03330 [Pseudomonadales bacterium]|nr:hypothetical protein [Pseudomonadales bacterium]